MNAVELSREEEVEARNSELLEPIWAVVSFDRVEAIGLTYAAAAAKMAELDSRKTNGLCIITDEAAARMNTSDIGNK